MKDPVQKLRNDLTQARKILKEGVFYTLTPDEKETLFITSGDLLEKLDSFTQSSLMVGLLGGTGVGKSSLMNALAGSEIAATSHRRPHTDSVLIYRYVKTPFPSDLPLTDVPWKEYTHEAESIQQIMLCDLPDFDSLIGEHRNHVIDFLQYLDVLVWVASPEKYADGRFYEFLKLVPKARQNFYFVLNKVDILFEGRSFEAGFEELEKVTTSLREYLNENGFDNPLIYTLSTAEAKKRGSRAHWNQFSTFLQQIFQQREFKEIRNIKTANLDKEAAQFLSQFEKELMNLEILQEAVESFIAELKAENSEWSQVVHESVASCMETRQLKSELVAKMTNPSIMVGSTSGFAFLSNLRKDREDSKEQSFIPFTEEIAAIFKRHSDRLKNRLVGQFLRKGIPSSFTDSLEDIAGAANNGEDLNEKLKYLFNVRFASPCNFSHLAFQGIQYVTYFFIFFILLISLAGEGAWHRLFEYPGWANGLNFIVTAMYALFTPRGLAALGSYALINIFFGYRFYIRYNKLLGKNADQLIDSLKKELEMLWEEELDRIQSRLIGFEDEIKNNIQILAKLKSEYRISKLETISNDKNTNI